MKFVVKVRLDELLQFVIFYRNMEEDVKKWIKKVLAFFETLMLYLPSKLVKANLASQKPYILCSEYA